MTMMDPYQNAPSMQSVYGNVYANTPTAGQTSPMGGAMGYGGSDNSLLQSRIVSIKPNQTTQIGGGSQNYNGLLQKLLASLQSGGPDPMSYFNQAQKQLTNLGKSEGQLMDIQAGKNKGQAEQDLVSRGLGNTTIRTSALSGVQRNADLAKNNLLEGVAAQKSGLLAQQGGVAERQQGTYLDLIRQLAQSLGQGQQGGQSGF